MIHIAGGRDVHSKTRMTGRDLLSEAEDPLSFSGMVMNRRYDPRVLFEKVMIRDQSEIQLIPARERMTIAGLIRQVKNLQYCSDVLIGDRLYPETRFHDVLVLDDLEVLLLPPMQGG